MPNMIINTAKLRLDLRKLFLVILLAVFCLGIASIKVSAHSADSYIQYRWPNVSGNTGTIYYNFVEGFPTGAFRDRINNGANSWNSSAMSMKPRLVPLPKDYPNFDPLKCNAPINGVHKLTGMPDFYSSYIETCVTECRVNCGDRDYDIQSVQLFFNTNFAWYTGTGGVNRLQIDLWSASTQMFGTFMGWSSPFDSNDKTLCAEPGEANYINRQTMCDFLPPPGALAQRDPSTHDIHTTNEAY